MAVEVGQFVRGTVVRLLNYGVLVRLEDGSTGLVHISEIDNNYVRNVGDYFQVNDPVTVKVLSADERGKIELSVKQAMGQAITISEPSADFDQAGTQTTAQAANGSASGSARGDARLASGEPMAARRESRASFEDKMGEFMRSSAERLGDLKRNIENKRGGKKTR